MKRLLIASIAVLVAMPAMARSIPNEDVFITKPGDTQIITGKLRVLCVGSLPAGFNEYKTNEIRILHGTLMFRPDKDLTKIVVLPPGLNCAVNANSSTGE